MPIPPLSPPLLPPQGLSDAEFESLRAAAAANLVERDQRLTQETHRHSVEILKHRYWFNARDDYADAVKTVTRAQIKELFQKYLLADAPFRRKLSVQVFGGVVRDHRDSLRGRRALCITPLLFPRFFSE